jgi:PAS domain S-box-containing protein
MAAGLICGPYIGIGSGIIGGLFRFAQGGPYMWTGLSAPILSGIIGGIMYLANKRRFVPTWIAVVLIGLSETLISCYTLVLVTKPQEFFSVVTMVAIPMVVFNILGMFIFSTVVHRIFCEIQVQKENQKHAIERDSQKNLEAIINTIADPVFVKDRDHRLTLVNDGFCHLFGCSREDLIGKTEYDFFPRHQSDRFRAEAETIFLTGAGSENESTFTAADGHDHTIITKLSPYTESSGNRFIVGIITDISDRKKMEDKLKANEERYRAVFETTGTSTILFEENTVISLVNAEFERMSGYSRKEIEGKMSWTGFIYPEDRERVLAQYRRIRESGDSSRHHYEFRFRTRAGEIRNLDLIIGIISGTNQYVASMEDITDTILSRKILELVNKKINLLSSITRHDILNQLMVLKGYLSLSTTMVENPVLLEYINKELLATQTIEHQINFTRDYENMGVKIPDWQNVNGALLKAKHALVHRDIAVDIDIHNPEVYADPLFEKVMYNLTDNALRYGGDTMTLIRVTSRESDQGLVISFEDNGAGIPEADKKSLFKRGFGKNTGFGLFLSREILSITGISITETGIFGKGARFEITVPKGSYRLEKR